MGSNPGYLLKSFLLYLHSVSPPSSPNPGGPESESLPEKSYFEPHDAWEFCQDLSSLLLLSSVQFSFLLSTALVRFSLSLS